jgi:integrase
VDWKLAVSRFGGLRIPSELRTLRWVDVLFDEQKGAVHATKTKRIEGKAVRGLPMFPESEPLLRDALEAAADGAEFVFGDESRRHANLGTQFRKIVKRAGFKPWPRLQHNRRGSRQTDRCDSYPPHVVCDWLGNDPKTALKHHLRTTKDHFARATTPSAQKALAATAGDASQAVAAPTPKRSFLGGIAGSGEPLRALAIADEGGNWHRPDSNR